MRAMRQMKSSAFSARPAEQAYSPHLLQGFQPKRALTLDQSSRGRRYGQDGKGDKRCCNIFHKTDVITEPQIVKSKALWGRLNALQNILVSCFALIHINRIMMIMRNDGCNF